MLQTSAAALSTSRWKGTLMPRSKSSRARRAVNPESIEVAEAVLTFSEAGLAVLPRNDLTAVEVRARDRKGGVQIVLAVKQARALALLLLSAAETVEAAEDRP
jgi:hypothetical protein